jgi:hypothetical protein
MWSGISKSALWLGRGEVLTGEMLTKDSTHAHTGLCTLIRREKKDSASVIAARTGKNHAGRYSKTHFPRCQVSDHNNIPAHQRFRVIGSLNACKHLPDFTA